MFKLRIVDGPIRLPIAISNSNNVPINTNINKNISLKH